MTKCSEKTQTTTALSPANIKLHRQGQTTFSILYTLHLVETRIYIRIFHLKQRK